MLQMLAEPPQSLFYTFVIFSDLSVMTHLVTNTILIIILVCKIKREDLKILITKTSKSFKSASSNKPNLFFTKNSHKKHRKA